METPEPPSLALARGGGRPRQPPLRRPHPARPAPGLHAASPTHPPGQSTAQSLPPTGRPRAAATAPAPAQPAAGPAHPPCPLGPELGLSTDSAPAAVTRALPRAATAGHIGLRPDAGTRQDPLATSNNKKSLPHSAL